METRNEDWADVNRFTMFHKGKENESILDDRPTLITEQRHNAKLLPKFEQHHSAKLVPELKQHHSARINAVCIFVPPKGSRYSLATILTASADTTVCIWSLSGKYLRKLEYQHEKAVTSVQVFQHPRTNELLVITGSEDRRVIIWDYHTGAVKVILKGVGNDTKTLLWFDKILFVDTISRKNSKSKSLVDLVIVDHHNGYIFDFETKSIKTDESDRVFNSNNSQFSCAALCHWSERGAGETYAAITVDIDGKIAAWDLLNAKLHLMLETAKAKPCHKKKITAMAVLQDASSKKSDIRVVTGGEDCQIFVWSLDRKNALNRLMFGHKGAISGIKFYDNRQNNPKDIKMITVGEEGALLVWDYYRAFRKEEGSKDSFKLPLFSPRFEELQNPLTCLSIYVSPGIQSEVYIITADDLGNIQRWRPDKRGQGNVSMIENSSSTLNCINLPCFSKTKKEPDQPKPEHHTYLNYEVRNLRKRHSGAIRTVVYCDIDDTLITAGDDKSVVQWSLTDHRVKYNMECGHHSSIVGLAIIPTRNSKSEYSILAVDTRGDAVVWTSDNEKKRNSFKICTGGAFHEKKSKVSGLFHHKTESRDYILTVSNDRSCLIWELDSQYAGVVVHKLEYDYPQLSVTVHSYKNETFVFTTGKNLVIMMWPLFIGSDGKVCRSGQFSEVSFDTTEDGISASRIEDTEKAIQLVAFSYEEFTSTRNSSIIGRVKNGPRETQVAICACCDSKVKLWKLKSPEWVFIPIKPEQDFNILSPLSCIAIYQSKPGAAMLDKTFIISVVDTESSDIYSELQTTISMWNCSTGSKVNTSLKPNKLRIEERDPKNPDPDPDPNLTSSRKEVTRQVAVVKRPLAFSAIAVTSTSKKATCVISTLKEETTTIALDLLSHHVKFTDGLSLTLSEGGSMSEEVEVTTSSDKENIFFAKVGPKRKEVALEHLKVWRQGQEVVGFCFVEKVDESTKVAHLCYTDKDTGRVAFVYNYPIEVSKHQQQHQQRLLETEFRSLKYKALFYYCKFNDTHKIDKALSQQVSKLAAYYHKGAVSDPDFRKLTEVPLIDTLGLVELSNKYPVIFRDFICKLQNIDVSNVMFSSRNFEYDFPLGIEHIESRPAYDVDGNYCWDEERDLSRIRSYYKYERYINYFKILLNAGIGIGFFNEYSQRVANFILDSLLYFVTSLARGLKYCLCLSDKKMDKYLQEFQSNLDKSKMVSLFVPLPHAGSLEMLQAYVTCCNKLDDCSIFDNKVVVAGLKFAWSKYGRTAHLTVMGFYARFVITLMLSTLLFQRLLSTSTVLALTSQVLVLVFSVTLIIAEIRDILILVDKRSIIKFIKYTLIHLWNPWNFLDLLVFVFTFSGTAHRIRYMADSKTSTSLLAVAIVATWIRSLYFFQAFKPTGPLISMILHVTWTILPFLGILLMVLTGFAAAFFILSQYDQTLPFGTINGAFLASFDYMMGNFDSDFNGTSNPVLATILFVLYIIFCMVIMFNLLIAIMSNAYTEVQSQGLSTWRREQATMIIELKRYLPKDYLNAVTDTFNTISKRYSSDQASEGARSDDKIAVSDDKEAEYKGKGAKSQKKSKLGEGCYLHILKRTDYEASKRTAGADNSIQDIKSKLDEIIKILKDSKEN